MNCKHKMTSNKTERHEQAAAASSASVLIILIT